MSLQTQIQRDPSTDTDRNVTGEFGPDTIRQIYPHLLQGSAWMFAARVGGGLLSFAAYVVLARLLIPGDLGAYFLTVSVVTAGVIVASLGLNEATVRFIGEFLGRNEIASARDAVLRALQLCVFGAILGVLLYVGMGRFLAIDLFHQVLMAAAVGLTGAWIGLAVLQKSLSSIFRGLQHFHLCALFAGPPGLVAGGALVTSLLVILAVKHHSSFEVVVWLSAGSTALASVLGIVLLAQCIPRESTKVAVSIRWTRVMSVAWPLLVTDLLLYVISQTDLWFLGGFRSAEDVAIYAASWRLAQLIAVPLAVTNAVLPPFIAQLYVKGEKKHLERLLRRFATWGSIPAIIGCLIALSFGRPVLDLFYGPFYSRGAVVLAVLSIGQAANVFAGSCGFTLMMTGHERTMMVITGISGTIFLGGEALVVRPLGIDGVAWIATGAMILQNFLMLFFAKRRVGVWTSARLFAYAPQHRVLADG